MALTTKNKPFSPFQNEIMRLSNILNNMGMIMVKTDNHQYQMMYSNENISKGKIIPFSEITKDREAVRELLSVATDILFDSDTFESYTQNTSKVTFYIHETQKMTD